MNILLIGILENIVGTLNVDFGWKLLVPDSLNGEGASSKVTME